ncbi:MAG: hypothetical protein WC699_04940 [Bacteroidales bacterium]|jgi:hypothetical protein
MKKQTVVLLFLVSMLALGACDKISELIGTSNLPGTWEVTSITQKIFKNGVLDTTMVQDQTGTITFNKEGDGTFTSTVEEETQSGTFDWFEKDNKVYVNGLNIADSIMTKNLAIGFDVVTNSATKQVWSVSFSEYQSDEDPATGEMQEYLMKMYMEVELLKQ